MTWNRWVVIGLIFVLSAFFLSLYLLFAVNQYSWMHEIDDSVSLPSDHNLSFKIYFFGLPAVFMLFALIYYSFSRFGVLVKTLSVVYSLVAIAVLVSRYPV